MVVDTLPIDIIHLFEEHGSLIKVEKGSNIFQEGECATEILLIKEGTVQISKETEDAKEITFRICGSQSIIGECPLFSETTVRSTTAKANVHTELLALSKDSLEMMLTQKPALMIEYLKWLQNENLKNQSLLRDLILHGKKGALYSTLIRLANTYGEPLEDNKILIKHFLTNTEIANLCSTSREMINRMLNELKKQKIISFDKGYITIMNISFLKQAICCENCPSTICRID
ncbi:Crp/Fnr family transcriptional regulator [Ureibacillus xyleni]|uniref:Crp/Fnr family transcriptional regulator n=1 Tax=Ureibacillus xyleni TaxID=614648 RepID=A0A285RDA4_9BACL|nr:Crp/Fnr family transcriptional regulator [Ureibacillus xyleni]SOB91649.1 Crp/Fnr family transcriptional regulator [Ureibacillus xyleni]